MHTRGVAAHSGDADAKAQVRKYVTERKVGRAENAAINRELAVLRRGYSLNKREVTVRPTIEMLKEDNARQGFFDRGDFERVRAALPEEYRALLTVAYITGWLAASELLPMEWRQVDFEAHVIRLEPGTTKNDRGREFPFTDELEAVLLEQRARTNRLEREHGMISTDRKGAPSNTGAAGKLQALLSVGLARREVGEDGKLGKIIPSVIVHDFRRTAIRKLARAGVSEAVAMQLCGHETRSVYDRYQIVTGNDLREAAAKLNAVTSMTGKVTGKVSAVREKASS